MQQRTPATESSVAPAAIRVCLALILTLIPLCGAWAQGFMVKPMRIDVQAGAGDTVKVPLEVRNALAEAQTVGAHRKQLWQSTDGSWSAVDEEQAAELTQMRSCLEWLSFDSDRMELNPYASKEFELTLNVPRGARGTYGAALLVRSEPPEGAKGIVVVIQFLVPVIVQVQGPSPRERVEFADLELIQTDEEGSARNASLIAKLNNDGETLVRVGGELRLLNEQGGAWRPVATVPLRTRAVLPGVHLEMDGTVGRRLPSGKYRLEGRLTANGRRLGTVTRELEFEGDPEAELLTELPLEVEAIVALEMLPEKVRTGNVTVKNPSTDVAGVQLQVLPHPALRGVGDDNLQGTDFDAAEWITVMPEQFTLRGNTERVVRLQVRAPQPEKALPNYYALLKLQSSYPDGQPAGSAESLLWVRNEAVQSRLAAETLSVNLSEGEASQYTVTASFANCGTVHWSATCRAEVLGEGRVTALSSSLETATPRLLPLGTGTYSSILDFSKLEAGSYVLNVTLDYGGEQAIETRAITVAVGEDGTRTVSMAGDENAGEQDAGGQ